MHVSGVAGRRSQIAHGNWCAVESGKQSGLLDGDLTPELCRHVSKSSLVAAQSQLARSGTHTGGGSGVRLDGLTLLDEGVLGGGQAALDELAHDGAAELGVQPGHGAGHEAVGNHDCGWLWVVSFN